MKGKHVERAIPENCPECFIVIAQSDYKNHCEAHWCGWIVCGACYAVIDTRSGRHMGAKK